MNSVVCGFELSALLSEGSSGVAGVSDDIGGIGR